MPPFCVSEGTASMGDDICKPHQHFGRGADTYVCHHFFAKDGAFFCIPCGGKRESVVSRDAARKLRDRLDR